MAACYTQTPEVQQTKILIHLSFKRLLIAWGQDLDTLGEFHCFVPLTPLKNPVSLPLWEGIFLAGPFLFVLCHLSQGSLLRGWLLPCWEQVVTASGYWQSWGGGASVCPPCWMYSCYPSDREKKAFLGKKKRCRGDLELLMFQLLDCQIASWKSPQNSKKAVSLTVMENIITQKALGFCWKERNCPGSLGRSCWKDPGF